MSGLELSNFLHNYKTGETEIRTQPPTDWRDYIPQDEVMLALYDCYIGLNMTPAEAAKNVLMIATGQQTDENRRPH